jgi:hypothetical protein
MTYPEMKPKFVEVIDNLKGMVEGDRILVEIYLMMGLAGSGQHEDAVDF